MWGRKSSDLPCTVLLGSHRETAGVRNSSANRSTSRLTSTGAYQWKNDIWTIFFFHFFNRMTVWWRSEMFRLHLISLNMGGIYGSFALICVSCTQTSQRQPFNTEIHKSCITRMILTVIYHRHCLMINDSSSNWRLSALLKVIFPPVNQKRWWHCHSFVLQSRISQQVLGVKPQTLQPKSLSLWTVSTWCLLTTLYSI